jgi:hypothetical protein
VLVLDAVNITAGEQRTLSEAMRRGLERRLEVVVTVEDKVGKLPADCLGSTSCVRTIVSSAPARQILTVSLVRIGTAYRISFSAIDPTDAGVSSRGDVDIPAGSDGSALVAARARSLLPTARVRGGPPVPTGVWIASGLSVAALGVGTYLALSARADYRDCDDRSFPDFCPLSSADDIDRKALAADLTLGVAAGAAVTAGLWWWLSRDAGTEQRISVRPSAGPRAVGLVIQSPF